MSTSPQHLWPKLKRVDLLPVPFKRGGAVHQVSAIVATHRIVQWRGQSMSEKVYAIIPSNVKLLVIYYLVANWLVSSNTNTKMYVSKFEKDFLI